MGKADREVPQCGVRDFCDALGRGGIDGGGLVGRPCPHAGTCPLSRYKPADLERMGESARRQIALARVAMRCQDALKAEKAGKAGKADNKFHAQSHTDGDGRFHASKAEGKRWHELKLMHRAGRITNLIHQPTFDLEINGVLICRYRADAEYLDADGNRVIEDTKGVVTPIFRIKRKLMAALHGITITEISA